MDIHKPKPVHGWREFASEIGVIVIGVCIALAGEQAVEAWHWRDRVREAEASMTRELGSDNGVQAEARIAISSCITAGLDRLEAGLTAKRVDSGSLALPTIQAPPFRTWDNDAWRAAEASGATSHMSTEAMYKWSGPYTLIADMDQATNREFNDWAPLVRPTSLSPHPSEIELERIAAAIANARRDNELLTFLSSAFVQFSHEAGVSVPRNLRDFEIRRELKEVACDKPALVQSVPPHA